MNPLFKAFLERELKSVFGDLLTYFRYEEYPKNAITIVISNLDKTRVEGKQLANIVISMLNDDIRQAKFPLDIFAIRVKDAYNEMKHFIEKEVA